MTTTAALFGVATAAVVLRALDVLSPRRSWHPLRRHIGHWQRPSSWPVLEQLAVRRRERRRQEALADDLPETTELIAIAAAAGCNVRLALEAVRRSRDGPAVRVLAAVLADVDVGGDRLADALGRAPIVHGEAVRPLTALLADAERYGTPLGTALERLGDDLRQRRRRRAEERARALPVRLLLPLVLCILPAFALLTVAPLLASGIRALADHT
jgi:tight adherence protein C